MTEKKQGRALCKDSLRFGTLLVLALLVAGNTFVPLAEAKTALPPTTTEIAPTTAVVATTTKTIIPPRPIVITAPTRPAGNTGGSSKPQSGGGFAEFGKIIQTFLPLVNTFSNLFKGGGSGSSGGASGNTQSGGCSTCGTGGVKVNGGSGTTYSIGNISPADKNEITSLMTGIYKGGNSELKNAIFSGTGEGFFNIPNEAKVTANLQRVLNDPIYAEKLRSINSSLFDRITIKNTPSQPQVTNSGGSSSINTPTAGDSTTGTNTIGNTGPNTLIASHPEKPNGIDLIRNIDSQGKPILDAEGRQTYTSCKPGDNCGLNAWVVSVGADGKVNVINNPKGDDAIKISDTTTFKDVETGQVYPNKNGALGEPNTPGFPGPEGVPQGENIAGTSDTTSSLSGYPDFDLPETPTPYLPEGYETSLPVDSNGVPFFDPNQNAYASWEDLQQFNQNPTNDYSSFFDQDGYTTPEFDAMLTTETFYTAPENPLFTDWNEIYDVESYNPAWNPSDFETTDNFADYTPQEIGFEGYENFYSNEYDFGFVNDPYSTYENPWEGVTTYTGSEFFNAGTTYDNFGANAFDFSPTDYYGNPYFEAPNDSYLDFDTSYTGFDGYSAAPSGWDFSSDYTTYNNFDTFGGYDDYSYTESYETPYQSGGYDWEDEFWNGDW